MKSTLKQKQYYQRNLITNSQNQQFTYFKQPTISPNFQRKSYTPFQESNELLNLYGRKSKPQSDHDKIERLRQNLCDLFDQQKYSLQIPRKSQYQNKLKQSVQYNSRLSELAKKLKILESKQIFAGSQIPYRQKKSKSFNQRKGKQSVYEMKTKNHPMHISSQQNTLRVQSSPDQTIRDGTLQNTGNVTENELFLQRLNKSWCIRQQPLGKPSTEKQVHPIGQYKYHRNRITPICYSTNGIYTASIDGKVCRDGQVVNSHRGGVQCILLHNGKVISGGRDSYIRYADYAWKKDSVVKGLYEQSNVNYLFVEMKAMLELVDLERRIVLHKRHIDHSFRKICQSKYNRLHMGTQHQLYNIDFRKKEPYILCQRIDRSVSHWIKCRQSQQFHYISNRILQSKHYSLPLHNIYDEILSIDISNNSLYILYKFFQPKTLNYTLISKYTLNKYSSVEEPFHWETQNVKIIKCWNHNYIAMGTSDGTLITNIWKQIRT